MADGFNEEKREDFRVSDTLPLSCKSSEHACGCDAPSEVASLLEGKEIDPALAAVLKLLDDKLNAVLDMLGPKAMLAGKPNLKELNISAGGLSFVSTEPYEVGEVFELVVGLPPTPFTMMTVHGEVVRVSQKMLEGIKSYEVGVKFLHLDEGDRQGLVKYLFDTQRKTMK